MWVPKIFLNLKIVKDILPPGGSAPNINLFSHFTGGGYKTQACNECHPSGWPQGTYNLLFVCRGHAQGHFPLEGAV